MPEFSVVTIVKGRRRQLANLLQSIIASTMLPFDVQVVCMDNMNGIDGTLNLNVRLQQVDKEHDLPLAAARNAGIRAAQTDTVIFVDVDCIVSPTLFEKMMIQLRTGKIITAYPLYLSTVPATGNFAESKSNAITHPARESITPGEPVEHLQFWSLIFAVQRTTFEEIGGFDETYTGYGAEDTDFAMMFDKAGVQLIFINDYVLHQYHDKYDPPLNHFDSIIENATRFLDKWGVLPMRSWLSAFRRLGLIDIEEDNKIIIRKRPTYHQIKENLSKHPY